MPIEELIKILLEEESAELKGYNTYFDRADPDRALLLTTHLIVENLLNGLISTQLRQPEVFLKDADFRAKINLARALCVIGPRELTICTVLNKARNEMVHTLKPLAPKWRIELDRLAFGRSGRRKSKKDRRLDETLLELFLIIAACWKHAKFHKKIAELVREHGDRWQTLMMVKIKEHVLAGDYDPNDKKLGYEVSLELARELRQKKG